MGISGKISEVQHSRQRSAFLMDKNGGMNKRPTVN